MKTSGNGIISTTALISPKPRSMGLRNGPLWCIETITYILRLIKQLFDINQKLFQCHQFSAGWRHEQQLQVKSSEHHFGKVETKANTFHTQLLLFSCWVWLFATPWTAARQASLSFTITRSFLRLISVESVMPSNHLILCHLLFLLPSLFPSIRVFSNESALRLRWPKHWSFSFSISPSNEYSGMIFFRMDWLDLLAVQGTLKSLLQHHSSKASILWPSAFFIVQLSHPYITAGKIIALTRQTLLTK